MRRGHASSRFWCCSGNTRGKSFEDRQRRVISPCGAASRVRFAGAAFRGVVRIRKFCKYTEGFFMSAVIRFASAARLGEVRIGNCRRQIGFVCDDRMRDFDWTLQRCKPLTLDHQVFSILWSIFREIGAFGGGEPAGRILSSCMRSRPRPSIARAHQSIAARRQRGAAARHSRSSLRIAATWLDGKRASVRAHASYAS